jgi:hypothetical protein
MEAEKIKKAVLAVLIGLFISGPAWAAYGGGSGTAGDPYLINTAEQMQAIGTDPCDWDKNFKLTADIDLSAYTGEQFNIIGYKAYISGPPNYDTVTIPFTGVFDGNGHTISNFTYSCADSGYENVKVGVGMFGYGESAEIKNLGLINPNLIHSGSTSISVRMGSLVGQLEGAIITNCYADGGSVTGLHLTGGLAGYLIDEITVSDCYSTCRVRGDNCGGLIGACWWGTVTNCYATGNILCDTGGGLISTIYTSSGSPTTVSNCYAIGNIMGVGGGLVKENSGTIYNCYSTGSVTSGGGLVMTNSGTVSNSFWDKETSGMTGSAGGTGKTTVQMKNPDTFLNASWDLVGETTNGSDDIWAMCSCGGCYPKFSQNMEIPSLPGDSVMPAGVDFGDFAFVAKYWPETDCAGQYWSGGPCGADLDGSGSVDSNDVAILAANWLEGIVGPPVMFYEFNLDTDPGWTFDGEWAFGQPTGGGGANGNPDPSSGYTGTNVYGVDLDGDYDPIDLTGPFYLTTGPLDCSNYSNQVVLKFARWLNCGEFAYHRVEVSTNGSSWDRVWYSSSTTDNSWQPVEYDISYPAAGQETVYIRWSYTFYCPYEPPRPILPYSGWNIDDVELWGN